jgi:hypothetical protein
MNKVFENSVFCGFLLVTTLATFNTFADNHLQAYCECKYNSENIRFIIEIGKFRDAFNADKKCWPRKWKEIDEKLMNEDEDSIDCTWPSVVVSEENINMIMSDIWDTFIFPDGDTPAFFPSEVVRRTQRRMKLVAHYGPQVFEESTMDHVRNIHREIRPQFLHSTHYQELRCRMKALVRLPTEKDFSIPYRITCTYYSGPVLKTCLPADPIIMTLRTLLAHEESATSRCYSGSMELEILPDDNTA